MVKSLVLAAFSLVAPLRELCEMSRDQLRPSALGMILAAAAASGAAYAQYVPARDPPPGWPGESLDGASCAAQGKAQGYGPYDYNDPAAQGQPLEVVNRGHFTKEVELLVRGNTTVDPAGDLDYTLRAFPNHHKALSSLINYYFLQGHRSLSIPPPECYLQRAIKFRPKDGLVWMIYGVYLHRRGEYQSARDRYEEAVKLMPESSEAHYNLGLLYADLKDYDKALEQAEKAYGLGFPLPGLRDRLKESGRWH